MQSPGAQSVHVPLSDVQMSPAGQSASVAQIPSDSCARQTSGSPATPQCGRQVPPRAHDPHAAASMLHSSVVVVVDDVDVSVVVDVSIVDVVVAGVPAQIEPSSLQSASVLLRQKFRHEARAAPRRVAQSFAASHSAMTDAQVDGLQSRVACTVDASPTVNAQAAIVASRCWRMGTSGGGCGSFL